MRGQKVRQKNPQTHKSSIGKGKGPPGKAPLGQRPAGAKAKVDDPQEFIRSKVQKLGQCRPARPKRGDVPEFDQKGHSYVGSTRAEI